MVSIKKVKYLLLFLILIVSSAQLSKAQMQPDLIVNGRRTPTKCVFRISNPKGLYNFSNYTCPSFSQNIEKLSDTTVKITVNVSEFSPHPKQVLPITNIPQEVQKYLSPTKHIQSDSLEITKIAQEINESSKPKTETELVEAVLNWIRSNVRYGELNKEITDALTALNRKSSQCVGFAHLSAAILRNLGIPARTVRTYALCCCGKTPTHFTRHSLIELYYPDDKQWILYDPQSPVSPSPAQIYLYSDTDWNQKKHDECKPFCLDPNTHIEIITLE